MVKNPTKADLISEVENLKAQIQMLINNTETSNVNEIKATERVGVKTTRVQKLPLVLNGRDLIINGINDQITISLVEANSLVSSTSYKDQLITGYLYFTDDKWYDHFYITKPVILTDDYLVSVLNNEHTIAIFNQLTNNKSKFYMFDLLQFRVADLFRKNKINLTYEKRDIIEKYFKVTISKLIQLLNVYDKMEAEAI